MLDVARGLKRREFLYDGHIAIIVCRIDFLPFLVCQFGVGNYRATSG